MADPKIAVVIVNYRVARYTTQALTAILPSLQRNPATHVYVIENGSGGDDRQVLEGFLRTFSAASQVTLVPEETNWGFGGGNNVVLRRLLAFAQPPEFVLLLNPDTIAEDELIERLVAAARAHPKAGALGAAIVQQPNGEILGAFRWPTAAGDFAETVRTACLQRWQPNAYRASTETVRVDWASGACVLLRMSMLQQVGIFDEGYFLYYEETDLLLRAASQGWECWFVPSARVRHFQGASTKIRENDVPRKAWWFQSRIRYFEKHYGRLYRLRADTAWLLGQCIYRSKCFVLRRPVNDPPRLVRDFVLQSLRALCRPTAALTLAARETIR